MNTDDIERIELSDDIIEHFRELMETDGLYQWVVGDEIIDLLTEMRVEEFENEQDRIHLRWTVIKKIADRTGADRSTLRDRHNMALFFPPDIRERYSPLSYHQLRACKSAGDHWQDYAEWALSNLPAPVAVIREKVKQDLRPSDILFGERLHRLIVMVRNTMDNEAAPPEFKVLAERFLSALARLEKTSSRS